MNSHRDTETQRVKEVKEGSLHNIFILVFLCASAPLWQVTFEELRKVIKEIDRRMEAVHGNALTKLDALRALDKEYCARGPAARSAIAARILTFAPEVGNYDEALRY